MFQLDFFGGETEFQPDPPPAPLPTPARKPKLQAIRHNLSGENGQFFGQSDILEEV